MNHQAIEFLARDRINGFAREAAGSRLAHEARPSVKARWIATPRLLGGSLRGIVVRGGALVSGVRALVSRA